MSKKPLTLLALLSVASGALAQEAVPGEVLVKFKEDRPTNEASAHSSIRAQKLDEVPNLKIQRVKVPQGVGLAKALAHYRSLPSVEYAEPNYIFHVEFTPNDPGLGSQWGLTKVGAQGAWDITQGSSTVRIAILDTGVDHNHPDLRAKLVPGYDFARNDTLADDEHGHGTHVAGIAAASGNNGLGVAGLGLNCSVMPVKVMDNTGSGSYAWLVSGIRYAADNGAKVISMSLGAPYASQAVDDAVNYAWSKGAIVVAAAGNSNTTTPHYPAYSPNVIAVASTDQWDLRSSFSNYGSWVDVAAPGSGIYSTLLGGGYGSMSGTSMATPFVAGQAGLLWSYYGTSTTPSVIRQRIESTATPVGSFVAYGRIDALKSLPAVTNRVTLVPTVYSPLFAGATSGTIASLAASDDALFSVNSRLMGWRQVADYYVEVRATDFLPSSIEVDFEGRQSAPTTAYASLYNWAAGRWDGFGSIALGSIDKAAKWVKTSPSAYVSSTGQIRVRLWSGVNTTAGFSQGVDRFNVTLVR